MPFTYARRLWQEEEADTEDESPSKLNGHGDAVGAGVHAVHRGVVDYSGEEQANRDTELVAGDNGTTNSLGCHLGHVQDDYGADEANTNARNETSGDKDRNCRRRDLEDDTDREDATSSDDGGAATEPVGQGSSEERTEEGPSGQDRYNERFLPGLVEAAIVSIFRRRGATKLLLEGIHGQHTADVSRIIAEENTANVSESYKRI